MVGVGDNVFQTVNKAAVAQHAPPELVGTVMGMSGECLYSRSFTDSTAFLKETFVPVRGPPLKSLYNQHACHEFDGAFCFSLCAFNRLLEWIQRSAYLLLFRQYFLFPSVFPPVGFGRR